MLQVDNKSKHRRECHKKQDSKSELSIMQINFRKRALHLKRLSYITNR